MSQLIAALVQLLIAQLQSSVHHSHRIRPLAYLLRNQLVQAAIAWILPLRVIPLHQQALALALAQQPQLAYQAAGINRRRLQHLLQMGSQPLDRPRVEEVGSVLYEAIQIRAVLEHIQRQVQLRCRVVNLGIA